MTPFPEVIIILLDVSKNMLCPSNQLESKFDSSKSLLLHFLKRYKLNALSVMLFDSTCQVLQDFTEDYDSLITTLDHWNPQPNNSNREMKLACEFVERHVVEKFGPDQSCQIIMLTDGRPPQKQEHQSIQFHNPLWKLHIICLADAVTKSEHSQLTSQILEEYKKLLNRRIPLSLTKNHPKGVYTLEKGGAFCYLPYPHFKDSILSMMDIILEKYFLPTKGLLLCGQLRFPIKVYPVLPDVEYIQDVVRTLSIVAFKPREKLLGEPSIFRLWMFVDEEYDDQNKQVRNNSDYFSALWECLRKENQVAIVWMKGDNYAAIEPPPNINDQENSKEHGLFMYFTMYKSVNGKNLLSESSASSVTPPPKSYVAGHIDLPTPEHIESLLNKMSRYLTNLPNDAVKLKNVVEQIQRIIEIFGYKPLREQVVDKLHDVRIQSVEIENRQILAECLLTLDEEEAMSENDEDQEIMDYEEYEPREDEYEDEDNNKPPSPPSINRLSLNSLLN
ncbi:hypothetical protein RclHR1_00150031 [Rhizophagus clarus]|uniref:Integrator complex subunit 14 n=1 Tax=Rhizophagus clarus TaxID=94130 RepID=A0A2Z6QFW7_9GLOM|nr:hypothetical protein RclHR1_00150031 [Rhizophagus clarus]GET02314.1 integrator complex subunit 14 [Rhizophagus clarus]